MSSNRKRSRFDAARVVSMFLLLVRRGSQLGVFVAEKQKARFILLPDALEDEPAWIPLCLDIMTIIQGHLGLKDGERINSRKESN